MVKPLVCTDLFQYKKLLFPPGKQTVFRIFFQRPYRISHHQRDDLILFRMPLKDPHRPSGTHDKEPVAPGLQILVFRLNQNHTDIHAGQTGQDLVHFIFDIQGDAA